MSTPEDLQIIQSDDGLVADVRSMIEQTREGVARVVNQGITLLYWRIGKRIQTEVLGNQRAGYGDEIVATLSRQLIAEFGKGFSEKSLRRMVQFTEVFSEGEIVATLSRQLGWSHFKEIIPLKDDLQREFYAEMCRVERWSVHTLRERIQSMLFERTAIPKKPEEVAKSELAALREEDKLTPDLIFPDPYVLDLHELDQSDIHVAEYLTALPPRELLQQKLHAAIEISRARLEAMEGGHSCPPPEKGGEA